MYEIEKISYTNKSASATTARLRNQTLFANAVLANQSINNGLIRTTNTVAWTGGNAGNGSSATPIEAIEQGAVDTTLALYNTLIGSVPRLPIIPSAPLPNSTLYPYGCNIVKYNNNGAVEWTVDISGTTVSGYNLATDGTNIYAVGNFLGTIQIINSDRTLLATVAPITTEANGSFIVKYNVKGIAQWVAYLTSQTFLQLLRNLTDSVNSYQAGNCLINTNVYNSSGTLYRTLKPSINMYFPGAIANDGKYIYVIDSNSIIYQFKTSGELIQTKLLSSYGLSTIIPSVAWLNGYLYIIDNSITIWQLNTTFADPPVQFITNTSYPAITGSISITSDLANVLYLVNTLEPNKITKVTVNNTATPPSLTSVADFAIVPPVGVYNDGIITPLCVSYTYNSISSKFLIITDYNTNKQYPDVSGVVWSVGPVNTNTYNATVIATTSGGSTTSKNISVPLSVQGVYAVYNANRTSLLVYLTLYGSNTFVKFNYNGSIISNIKLTILSGASVLLNITELNSTLYVVNSTLTGGLYSINSTNFSYKQIYPLVANYNSAFMIKYSQSGAVSWISQIAAPNANCTVNAIVIGSTGIYLTGTFGATGTLIFYNSSGDSSGISLASTAGIGGSTAFVAKYTTSGTAIWATKIGNTNSTTGTSISVDGLGFLYVAGTYNGTRTSGSLKVYSAANQTTPAAVLAGYNSGSAVYLAKYTPVGLVVWATNCIAVTSNTVNAITATNDAIYLVGNANGNITCNSTNSSSFGPINISVVGNGVIIKYSSGGIAQWVTTLFGGIPYYISLFGNYLYISGQMTNPVSVYNVPYDVNGAVIPPPSGQPINSGVSVSIRGDENDFLIIYTTAGTAQWGNNTSLPYVTTTSTGGLTYGKNVEYVSVSILPPSNAISLYLYGNNVIKYTTSGRILWVADISGAYTIFGNLGTDGTNIYGSGTYYFNPETNINDCLPIIINADKTITIISNIVPVEGESGSFLVKYNTSGIAQWTNNLNNLFIGLMVHNGGKVYTTGFAGPPYGKYGLSPTIYNVNGIVFKSYSYVTSAFVIQYSTDGDPVWCSKISYEGYYGGGCFLRGITVSSSGVYVVGSFGNFLPTSEPLPPSVIRFFNANDIDTAISLTTGAVSTIFIAKYNTSGTPLWATKVEYNTGGTDGNTSARSIVIDSASPDSIYMLGEYTAGNIVPVNVYSASSQTVPTKQVYGGSGAAMILVKYNASGVVQWATNIRSPDNAYLTQYITPYGLAVSAGYIYITGSAYFANLATYDPTNATTDPSTGTQIQTGNTMVWSGNDGAGDGVLITYNTDGMPQWKTHITGTNIILGSVTIGGGNVYVGGVFNNVLNPPIITFYNTPDGTVNSTFVLTNTATFNNFTVAYNLQGKVQWVQNTSGPGTDASAGDSLTYTTALFVVAPGTGVA